MGRAPGPCFAGGVLDAPAASLTTRLYQLASNLLWTWEPEVIGIFRDLDPDLWRQVNHNPVALLAALPAEQLVRRAVETVYGQGYVQQRVDAQGWQHESYGHVDLELLPLRRAVGAGDQPLTVELPIGGQSLRVAAWRARWARDPPPTRFGRRWKPPGAALAHRAALRRRPRDPAAAGADPRHRRRADAGAAGYDYFPPELVLEHLGWLVDETGMSADDLLALGRVNRRRGHGWRDRPTDGVAQFVRWRRNCVAGRPTLHTWPGGAGEHEGESARSQPEPPRRAEREEAAGRHQGRAAYRAHGMRALRGRLLATDVAARSPGDARAPRARGVGHLPRLPAGGPGRGLRSGAAPRCLRGGQRGRHPPAHRERRSARQLHAARAAHRLRRP